jgi:hypothetical protein
MSAGTGVVHSEYNFSDTEELKLFQMWIETAREKSKPRHETRHFDFPDQTLIPIVSGDEEDKSTLFIQQNAHISYGKYASEENITVTVEEGRGIFLFIIEGSVSLENMRAGSRDSLEISDAGKYALNIGENTHFLLTDMPLDQ